MIDIPWSQEIVEDVVDLADCIELTVALDNSYDGRFTGADFRKAVQNEILVEGGGNFLQGEQVDDFYPSFEEAMELIKNRVLWLGEIYPFRQDDGEVQFAPTITSKQHYLSYLFLLACSCHKRIPALQNSLRVEFENLCKEAMRALFPAYAEILLFSQHSEDRKDLGWSAREAIPALAKKLNAQVHQKEVAKLPDTQREFGIDLIAICSFDDEAEYPFFAFAQCTVATEWWSKKHEAQSRHALSGYMRLDTDHANFLLIPHFPRIRLREWREDRSRTINCILCDRYRICRLLEKSSPLACQDLPHGMYAIFQEIKKHLPEHH